LIFIAAPSVELLKERLTGRGTEEAEVVAKRMKRAAEEAEEMQQYEYIVVNDELDKCVHTVHAIVISKRCELEQNLTFIEETKKGFIQI
jgi:guanylate kinase